MARRRKNRFIQKLPHSAAAIGCIIAGGLAIIAMTVMMILASTVGESVSRVGACIGVVATFISIVAVFVSLRELKNDNFNIITRRIAVVVSAIGAILWIAIYILGLIGG